MFFIAHLVTLIVLLILAAVSLSAVFSEKGIFSRAEKAGAKYNEAKAREVLETVLLADGQYEKHTNPKYNQDDFLDELIKSQIEGADVKGDVAIVGDYAFELDRSVPKIGRYLGLVEDLVFPTVDATVELAEDKKTATITITASEEKNGINKIEIWLLGEKIDEFPYDNIKTEITLPYTATQNGKYTIKAYGDLMASKTAEVDGILASVKFEPNGNEEWKKEHSTTVTIQETADKIVNAKYVWLTSVTTPDDSKFPEEQTFKSGDRITKNEVTGTYYLWTILTTESGEKVKWRSEGFNFDNEGPNITSFTSTSVNYSSFKLNLTAEDSGCGITKYEIFVKGVSQGEQTVEEKTITKEITINNATYGESSCYVIVTDKLGHTTRKDITANTQMEKTKPTISSFTVAKSSATAITLSATAQDTGTGIVKFEFYVDNVLKDTQTCIATTSSITKSKTITGLSTGSHTCKVIVYDVANNNNNKTASGTTKLYTWEKWSVDPIKELKTELVKTNATQISQYVCTTDHSYWGGFYEPVLNKTTYEVVFSKYGIDFLRNNHNFSEIIGKISSYNSTKYYKVSGYNGLKKDASNTGTAYWSCDEYSYEVVTTGYKKGTEQYIDVTGITKNEYPDKRRKRKLLVYI